MASPIIKSRRLQDDVWKVIHLSDGQSPADVRLPFGPVLVPIAVWREKKECLIYREYEDGSPLGVWLAPEDAVEDIAPDLDDFSVIAVHFPRFTDGRGYSTARLLRERYHYKGEIRAFGDIGRDQIFYLSRVGFNSFVLREGRDAEEALAAFAEITETYQAASDQPDPLFRRRVA
jgi:uncharacterized protein (DUF934 family)